MKTPPFLKDFIDLFFPRLCPVCQRALNRNEENICTTCLHRLPRTGYHLDPLSPMAQLYNPQIQISEKSQTKRLKIADSRKTKRPIIDKRTTPNKRHSNAIITL